MHEEHKDRFFDKVLKLPSGCWIWMAGIQGKFYKRVNGGYGSFSLNGGTKPAHRVSYEMHIGEIPTGYDIDHLCRITSCVNPAHLEAVTPEENYRRGIGNKGEFNSNKTHCPKGHEYTPENTRMERKNKKSSWYRACVTCRRETWRKYEEKRKPRTKKTKAIPAEAIK